MQRIGAPHDLYNLADIPRLAKTGLLDQYKMCLFLNPFYLTPEERGWLEFCKGGGRTLVWLWAPGLSQPGKHPSPKHVSEITEIPGIKWLQRKAPQVYRLSDAKHTVITGLPAGTELAALPFPPGCTWERFGNEVWPIIYVDTAATDEGTRVLGHWVLDGKVRPDMTALCTRSATTDRGEKWHSVYAAVPYLTPDLMRNMAHFAGAHIYRDANDILFASRHFVAVHTGKEAATGPLRLRRRTGVYDVFGERVVAESADTVSLDTAPYSTTLYHLGDPREFREAIGRPR